MLKRCLAALLLAVALVLSVGVHQLHAECSLTVHLICTPSGGCQEEWAFSC